jgi:hypothetical protein
MIIPKPKKPKRVKYSYEEELLFERIQKVRDEFEYKKKQIYRKLGAYR